MAAVSKLATYAIGEAAAAGKDSATQKMWIWVSEGADRIYLRAEDDALHNCTKL
jgi:hypothetical protein